MTDAIVCIATGPSLSKADIDKCQAAELALMAINNAYAFIDAPQYHYAGDTNWWKTHFHHTHACSYKYSIKSKDRDEGHPGVKQMRRGPTESFSIGWPVLCTGKNSGFQAVNLAYLLGFRKVILLGYDMKFKGDGTRHCHPDHPKYNPTDATVDEWIRIFNKCTPMIKEAGLEVINCTRDTDLECFPTMQLEEALKEIA